MSDLHETYLQLIAIRDDVLLPYKKRCEAVFEILMIEKEMENM